MWVYRKVPKDKIKNFLWSKPWSVKKYIKYLKYKQEKSSQSVCAMAKYGRKQ
jgi:hypothetical protein